MNILSKFAMILIGIAIAIIIVNYNDFSTTLNEGKSVKNNQNQPSKESDVSDLVIEKSKNNNNYLDENQNLNFWDKIKYKITNQGPELNIEYDQVTILNTDLEKLSDEDLICIYGVSSRDPEGDDVKISVEKNKKSENIYQIKFVAVDEHGITDTESVELKLVYNEKPEIEIKNRKIEIKQRKLMRYDAEKACSKITNKTKAKAVDSEDRKLDITCDLKEVNVEKKGEYSVDLIAEDTAKQESKTEIILQVK